MPRVFEKRSAGAPDGFFAAEAAGLRLLDEAARHGGVPVPQVISVARDEITMTRIEEGVPSRRAAERFGRELAATHATALPAFGHTPAEPSFIGPLDLPAGTGERWSGWFGRCRILPFLDRAGLAAADRSAVEDVVGSLAHLGGDTTVAACLHGDLWSGNVLWDRDDRVHVIDPSVHGGHPESDLAMLALFGLPYLDVVLAAYDETAPLAPGWQARVPLHQLYPLLVHAVLFGGSYRRQAGSAARAALAAR